MDTFIVTNGASKAWPGNAVPGAIVIWLYCYAKRILAGGFNTIRSGAPFTNQELSLLEQYDIKIIMGIWVDPHADFSQPAFVNQARAIVSDVLSYSKNYDNIIAYLIMNEQLLYAFFPTRQKRILPL